MASRVGKYLLFETLGEGAFGKVKLGVHEETGEQVAVKIMDKSDIKAQEMTMNVRREIAIMKALKHRNIVNLRQVLTSHTKLYIVMDLVTGGELFTKILKEGKLEEKIARRYFQQLVDGIDYCHKRGVCHRDLKPENLLIDETTGELKITDFGLSAMKGASTTEELLHTQCGSPNYCAPEIIARHKQGYSGTKVDAWSCGIILFALLAGFLPFYDENTRVLYNMIRYNDVKFPRKFPPEARDLVLCLLHKEPEKRYTLADVKKHPWFAVGYVGDDAPPKSIGSGSSPPGKTRRRRHARSSSVDQAPKSREYNGKRRSEKSDGDSASSNATGVSSTAFPDGHGPPVPPPVVGGGSRIPVAHRPPAQKSPVAQKVAPPQMPPPPPPPPVIAPTGPPQYQMHPMSPSDPIKEHSKANHTTARGMERAAPPYPSHATRMEVQSKHYSTPLSEGGNTGDGNAAEARIDNMDINADGARTPASVVAGMDLAPRPPTFPAPEPRKVDGHDVVAPSVSPAMKHDPIGGDSEINSSYPPPPKVATNELASKQFQPIDNAKLPPPNEKPSVQSSNTPVKSRWNVVLTPPATTTLGSSMAPVTTPAALADGDASWVKKNHEETHEAKPPAPPTLAAARKIGKLEEPDVLPDTETNLERRFSGGEASNMGQDKVHEKTVSITSSGTTDQTESTGASEKPLSIVEQRRLMYTMLAEKSDVSPPMPDTGYRVPQPEPSDVTADNALSERQRFGDRTERPVMTGYPTFRGNEGGSNGDHTNVPAVRGRSTPGEIMEAPVLPYAAMNGPKGLKSDVVVSAGQEGTSSTQGISTDGNAEGSTVKSVADPQKKAPTHLQSGAYGVPGLGDEGEPEVPLKERLTAALARYRRIFKLGNSIGITASPSFSSNKGGVPGDSSGDEDSSKMQSSGRSDFFARAKTVTGAWGIILTQELEDDSDSEDEIPQVTEDELQAFSRLLDFWDNRRASASVPTGGEVLLDDENSSPLSEADILSIQSLLQKLEPKQVEDEMTEVADDVSMTAPVPTHGMEDSTFAQDTESGAIQDVHISLAEKLKTPQVANEPIPTTGNTHAVASKDLSIQNKAPAPPLPPPPMPKKTPIDSFGTSPAQNDAFRNARQGVSWDRGGEKVAVSGSSVPPPPAPPPPLIPSPNLAVSPHNRIPPPPPPPPPYPSSETVAEPDNVRHPVSPPIVRDPFRSRAPPAYPPPQPPANRPGSSSRDSEDSNSKVSVGKSSGPHHKRGGRLPGRGSQDARRKSSTTASDVDKDGRRTTSRDSGRGNSRRGHSTASQASSGSSGLSKKSHIRHPSRDEHATRGLFAFGMFNRRKSSAMTSFESDLAPDRCLLEVGRILTGMGCNVLVKQGESKMKCEAPLKQEKLFISITCTQERRVSTVHFRRGRKDRSHVDAREFLEFFEIVQSRFQERVQPCASP